MAVSARHIFSHISCLELQTQLLENTTISYQQQHPHNMSWVAYPATAPGRHHHSGHYIVQSPTMVSIFSLSNGRSGNSSSRRLLIITLVLSVVVFWEASSLDLQETAVDQHEGGPLNEIEHRNQHILDVLHQEGEEADDKEVEDEEGLPMEGHLLAGPKIEDHYSSSYSCTCSDSSALISGCRNVHPHGNYSVKECGARIFYLISIHDNRTLHDALYLFRAVRDVRNTILIHLDVKFGLEDYHRSELKQEIEACPCGSHVEVASVFNCSWGSWSMNLPTFWSMEKAVKDYDGKWDVYINLSGDTLPVYTPDTIATLFAGSLKGINFITSSACETGLIPTPITAFPKTWHKRKHYSSNPANLEYVDDDGVLHRNVTITIYFGSQWMSLTPQWCEFLVRQMDRPDSLPSRFRSYLKRAGKLMADETFIPTMLMRFFPETVPTVDSDHFLDRDGVRMYAIRYERMDEHVPTSSGYYPTVQRYEVPTSSGVDSPRIWGPYFLG
jgi:hypothetical protein